MENITKQVESLRQEMTAVKLKPGETDQALKEEVTNLQWDVNDLKSQQNNIKEMKDMMVNMMAAIKQKNII